MKILVLLYGLLMTLHVAALESADGYTLRTAEGGYLGFVFGTPDSDGDAGHCVFWLVPERLELLESELGKVVAEAMTTGQYSWTRDDGAISISLGREPHLKISSQGQVALPSGKLVGDAAAVPGGEPDMIHQRTAVFIDAVVDDQPLAAWLLREHPQLLEARWLHGETVLHFLAVEGLVDGVRFLVDAGADVDAVNQFGDTALLDVASVGKLEVAEVLLAAGANPNAESDTLDNVLHVAARSGSVRLVDRVLAAGAHSDYVTDAGETIWDTFEPMPLDFINAIPESGTRKILLQSRQSKLENRQAMIGVLRKHGVAGKPKVE